MYRLGSSGIASLTLERVMHDVSNFVFRLTIASIETMINYSVWNKGNPKKTNVSRKRQGIFCCIFHQISSRYISERCVNFMKILCPHSTNKTMAVQKAKCHFVSEHQLISTVQLQEIDTGLIAVKKHQK